MEGNILHFSISPLIDTQTLDTHTYSHILTHTHTTLTLGSRAEEQIAGQSPVLLHKGEAHLLYSIRGALYGIGQVCALILIHLKMLLYHSHFYTSTKHTHTSMYTAHDSLPPPLTCVLMDMVPKRCEP